MRNQVKSHPFMIRLTPAELAEAKAAQEEAGLRNLSDLIRMAIKREARRVMRHQADAE